MEDQTFGDKLKIAREQQNLTRVQLAEQIGSSSKTIARWERGETLPRSQFHEKLCAILNTTPQELGLETKTVEEKQRPSLIHQRNSSPNSPVTLSLDKSEKGPKRGTIVITGMGVCCPLSFKLFMPDAKITRAGSGKSSLHIFLFDYFSGILSQGTRLETPPVAEPPEIMKDLQLDIAFPKNTGNKAPIGIVRENVISQAYIEGKKHISSIVKHPMAASQYALVSNFYGIILPTVFTIHLQIDIGGIVASMVSIIQTIHYVLSDPAWQGFGAVVGIMLPIIMGYKKKSFPVGPLSAQFALAA